MANIKLEVFSPSFERLGMVDRYTFISYSDPLNSVGSFELKCQMNRHNLDLLFGEPDRILWIEDEIAGIIQYSYSSSDEDGATLVVKGKLLNEILNWRAVIPQVNLYDKPDNIMRELVRIHYKVSGSRMLNQLRILESTSKFLESIRFQQTGKYVFDACQSISESNNIGFETAFLPKESVMEFRVIKGVDRSVNNPDVKQRVIFSRNLNNIITSSYVTNREPFKNTAIVAGEGEASDRVIKIVNDSNSNYFRRELFVDARDLQSNTSDGSATLTQVQYLELLNQRGVEKLKESDVIESFEASVRNDENTIFKYKKDYFKGDIVTVSDNDLGVRLSALLTGVDVSYSKDDGYVVEPKFGYSQPTITQALRRKGVI